MLRILLLILFLLFNPKGAGAVLVGEEDGNPDPNGNACWALKFANTNVTVNADGTCSIADQTGIGGAGDISSVGDCATGDCFTGSDGDTLTFNNAGGDSTLGYDGTYFNLSHPIGLETNGVIIDTDGDGALSVTGASAQYDENLTINLDDTENQAVVSSTSGVTTITLSGLTLTGNVVGNASTATALAADPSDCAAGSLANAIATDGDLTCTAQNAGTDITADLEEEAHCTEHDSTDVDCSGETITVVDDQHAHTSSTISGLGSDDISGIDISADTNLTAGDGISITDDDLDVDLKTVGENGVGTAASVSGMEFESGQLTLLQGCGDNEILKWDETDDDWNCEADGGGSYTAGDGILLTGSDFDIDLKTVGENGVGTTTSASGMEFESEQLTLLQGCNDGYVLKWEEDTDTWDCAQDADSGGSTAWSAIGDATVAGTVDFMGYDQDIESSEDGGDILTITNKDTDIAADSVILKLQHYDSADANAIFLQAINDSDGTPATLLEVAEDATTFSGVSTTVFSGVTEVDYADDILVDLSSINMSDASEGLKIPQALDCSSSTAEGQLCWETDVDKLWIGDAAAPQPILVYGTLTDTKYCTYDAAGNEIDCNSDAGAGGGDPVLVNTVGVADANGVDLTTGTSVSVTLAAAASPDTATFDVVDDSIAATELADADFGDWTCADGAGGCTLDADVVAAAEMADADHGQVSWSSGVATVEDMTCSDCIGDTEISTNAGTSLSADLEEEVTEGSLADSTIVSADIKNNVIDFTDMLDAMTLDASTSISFGTYGLTFTIANPASPAFDVNGTGNFSDDLVHFHQHTGNPTSGNILHIEATDVDIDPIFHVTASAADLTASVTSIQIDAVDNDDTDWTPLAIYDDSAATPDTLFAINSAGTITMQNAETIDNAVDGTINVSGDFKITGDDLYMNTNTAGMVLLADGTNFNPTAQNAGTDITADLEEEAHCTEHDSSYINCSGETIEVIDLTCTDCINDTEISTNAGTALSNDLEEEVTEGSLADSTIVSADIKDGVILSGDLSWDDALTDGDVVTYDSTGTNFDGVPVDASATCAANSICGGGHTHPTTELSGVNAGTDLTADLEEETHCADHDSTTINCSTDAIDVVDVTCTDCLGDTEVSTNAGTSLAADLEEEVTEGSLADSTIVSADIKDGEVATGDIAADTITHANIADSDQADTKCFTYYESDGIDDTDDWVNVWANKTANDFLLTEIWCQTDTGSVTAMLQVDDGTPADIDGTDIACDSDEQEDTSLDGDTTLAAGEELDWAITSTASTPTKMTVCWTGNWVD